MMCTTVLCTVHLQLYGYNVAQMGEDLKDPNFGGKLS